MKKNIIIAMIAILALLLCACGAKQEGFGEDDLGLEVSGETYYLRTDSAPLIAALALMCRMEWS